MNLTKEQFEIVRNCITAEELAAKAAKAGKTLSAEKAQAYIDAVSMVEISEDDLNMVAGGCDTTKHQLYDGEPCPYCRSCDTTYINDASFYTILMQCNNPNCGKTFEIGRKGMPTE